MTCLEILIKKYGNNIFGRRRKKDNNENKDNTYHKF